MANSMNEAEAQQASAYLESSSSTTQNQTTTTTTTSATSNNQRRNNRKPNNQPRSNYNTNNYQQNANNYANYQNDLNNGGYQPPPQMNRQSNRGGGGGGGYYNNRRNQQQQQQEPYDQAYEYSEYSNDNGQDSHAMIFNGRSNNQRLPDMYPNEFDMAAEMLPNQPPSFFRTKPSSNNDRRNHNNNNNHNQFANGGGGGGSANSDHFESRPSGKKYANKNQYQYSNDFQAFSEPFGAVAAGQQGRGANNRRNNNNRNNQLNDAQIGNEQQFWQSSAPPNPNPRAFNRGGGGGGRNNRNYDNNSKNYPNETTSNPVFENSAQALNNDQFGSYNEPPTDVHPNRPPNNRRNNNNNNMERRKNVPHHHQGGGGGGGGKQPAKYSQQSSMSSEQSTSSSVTLMRKDKNRREILIDQLRKNKYECMICYQYVRTDKAIWSCGTCFHIFHLQCVRKWAQSSVKSAQEEAAASMDWRCPGCQSLYASVPNKSTCFCTKKLNPEQQRGAEKSSGAAQFRQQQQLAHSCGEMCGKALALSAPYYADPQQQQQAQDENENRA